jgi:hypothetical protein
LSNVAIILSILIFLDVREIGQRKHKRPRRVFAPQRFSHLVARPAIYHSMMHARGDPWYRNSMEIGKLANRLKLKMQFFALTWVFQILEYRYLICSLTKLLEPWFAATKKVLIDASVLSASVILVRKTGTAGWSSLARSSRTGVTFTTTSATKILLE